MSSPYVVEIFEAWHKYKIRELSPEEYQAEIRRLNIKYGKYGKEMPLFNKKDKKAKGGKK